MATQRLTTLEEATQAIEASGLQKGPKRGGFYCPEGECYFVYLEDSLSFAERVDEFFTVYKDVISERLVGFQVKCTDVPPPHQLHCRLSRLSPDPNAPIEAVDLVVHALRSQGDQIPQAPNLKNYVSAFTALGQQSVPVRTKRELCPQ